MKIPLQITFRNFDHSDAIEADVRDKVAALERQFPRLISCRVVVERPHHRHTKGDHFHVSIDAAVPGFEVFANRNPPEHDAHEDVYVAIRDAFKAVTRELRHYVDKRRDSEHARGAG
jgi:ribosomal subunit interface protein